MSNPINQLTAFLMFSIVLVVAAVIYLFNQEFKPSSQKELLSPNSELMKEFLGNKP